jgi:hypothetical protein
MVLTKPELISSLQHEVRILLHLATKIDRLKLDYRPTPKQRSTIELLRYLTIMGPELVQAIKSGSFNPAAWTEAQNTAGARDFDQTVKALAALSEVYTTQIGAMSDADFRVDVEIFGNKASRGAHLVNMVIAGHAAYRTQLFVYLKACGREELSTMNLWAGMDAPAAAV